MLANDVPVLMCTVLQARRAGGRGPRAARAGPPLESTIAVGSTGKVDSNLRAGFQPRTGSEGRAGFQLRAGARARYSAPAGAHLSGRYVTADFGCSPFGPATGRVGQAGAGAPPGRRQGRR